MSSQPFTTCVGGTASGRSHAERCAGACRLVARGPRTRRNRGSSRGGPRPRNRPRVNREPGREAGMSGDVFDLIQGTNHAANGEARFRVRTARELDALPEPDASDLLLGPLVIRGARTILVADTGHGKTTIALQFVGAVLTGAESLGYTGAGIGPVLIVDLEQGIRSIKRSLRDAKLSDRADVLYLAVPDGLALDSEERERTELEQIVQAHRPVVVIVDPYYKAHRGDANEERAIVDLMRYLDRLRAKYGFALLMP